MKASINSIESFGAVDGPGIRTVVFFNGCNLRCKFCHNPETWKNKEDNISVDELFKKIVSNKPYYGNKGGVTFSGGEPLLHYSFILDLCKKLKKEDIHIALDTAGYCNLNYEELLKYIDLVIYDIKDISQSRYKELTGGNINITKKFIDNIKKYKNDIWIRLVVVPGIHDNYEYMDELVKYITSNFDVKQIQKIEFLPYHKMGDSKYEKLNISNPYKEKVEMNINKCNQLYEYFNRKYEEIIHLQ